MDTFLYIYIYIRFVQWYCFSKAFSNRNEQHLTITLVVLFNIIVENDKVGGYPHCYPHPPNPHLHTTTLLLHPHLCSRSLISMYDKHNL